MEGKEGGSAWRSSATGSGWVTVQKRESPLWVCRPRRAWVAVSAGGPRTWKRGIAVARAGNAGENKAWREELTTTAASGDDGVAPILGDRQGREFRVKTSRCQERGPEMLGSGLLVCRRLRNLFWKRRCFWRSWYCAFCIQAGCPGGTSAIASWGARQVADVSLWECWPAVAVATDLLMRLVDFMKFKVQPFCCVPILPSMSKIDIWCIV
ncbi:hypothetical protein MLD38_031473 [Melastoma candidum]|uniref:Uncharacterized protein n=1 Tax=Melastoma candidum TaxID=119954 RepID=A0ACB9MQB8_9MYRT|nr:hypothetical protein MLD38_031473 [Melastoma candidum]